MALFTSDKNSEKVQKTEAVLEDAAKAQEEEQAATKKVRAQSYWQVSWNIFKRNKLGMICLGIVLALAIIAILAPVIAPYSYKDQNLAIMNQNPTVEHLLGTDEYGRDILSRIIYGCQISLSVGIISQAIALFIGFVAGVAAGYYGRWVDAVVSFIIQVFSSFPFLLFAILIMFVMGPGLI
ncbi:MAG: ABC transporter permease, partial [Atopobium sp.]|nr:ABC transporter permease [Atopobium sp.]